MSCVQFEHQRHKHLSQHHRQRSESNLLSPSVLRRMNHSPAAAAITPFGSSQYSDKLRKEGPSSSRYYSQLSSSPRPLVHEYTRGWNRESNFHSVSFGMRGKETVEPYASPLVGSSRLTKDEPLVPRPTFIRPISASSASGSGSSCAYSSSSSASSKLTTKPPTSINNSPSSTASAAHFSISAHELYRGESKVFPNGSPYHCLRSEESAGSSHVTSRAANFYDNNRRRPKSVAADSSEATSYSGQLDWSAEIVRH